jgi:glycosyltransferase involved in cell wall biosynthesis
MDNPLVSVVMVTCNVDRFLAEAIESILSQTFGDFEFIIVDFGSTDKSKQIISSYAAKDSRIKFHEIPHCGLAEARNTSCSLAQGQYIAIMDADDVSLPERLMQEVGYMEKHPETGLLGGATEWVDARGRSVCTNYFPTEDGEIKSELDVHNAFCQPTVLLRKEAFILAGGYRAVFAPAEDYDLWLRITEGFQCANLTQVVLKYRIHPYQVSMRLQKQQTLGKLASQASASLRRNGRPDVLNSASEITPEFLAALGVTEAKQESEFTAECRQWIRHMYMAGEYSFALTAAVELSQSVSEHIARWQIADLHLTIARLYWRQRKPIRSFIAAGRALVTRPIVAGRALKPLLRWLGFV